jgi:23S rRNA (adenine2030-N6)-methyltransferase
MLSYQHVYHAGNHADILKHLTLTILLDHLNEKEKPYTVFDTHGGAGRYSLEDDRALKTGEAITGVKKLLASEDGGNRTSFQLKDTATSEQTEDSQTATDIQASYATYISICRAYGKHSLYPGSPEIERCLMRKSDTLILSELHPQAIEELRIAMQMPVMTSNPTAETEADYTNSEHETVVPHIHFRDGWETLSALTPPVIKRGMVLMDPSYEDESDYIKCADVLCSVHKKWPVGILALWYPLIAHRKNEIEMMKNTIINSAKSGAVPSAVVDAQLCITTPESMTGLAALYGSGMLIVNAPYKFDEKIKTALPRLANVLGGGSGSWKCNLY